MNNLRTGLIGKQNKGAFLFLRSLLFFCLSLFPAFSVFSQQQWQRSVNQNTVSDYFHSGKQADIWYFGEHAGIKFQDGDASPLTDQNVMTSYKSSAVISDSVGNLLFFTDGKSVWDRTFDTLPYAPPLDGDLGVTQSCIIVPQPGKSNIYYIFTIDVLSFMPDNTYETKGLEYSIVDMSLNNGLGNGTSQWNIPLLTPVCQKITAVYHQNGKNVWIITHKWDSDEFYAFLLDSNGLSSPVISNSGGIQGGGFANQMNAYGYLKASPDGSKIALAISGTNNVELYDFNNSSGNVSNPQTYTFTVPGISPYGIEFSTDTRKVYTSLVQINGNGTPTYSSRIYQFDLLKGMSPPVLIDSAVGERLGGMQLGTDGRIYLTRTITLINRKDSLDVIYNPTRTGLNCNYNQLGNVPQSRFSLNGRMCIYGLPNFIQSYFARPIFTHDSVCYGQLTRFNITNKANIDSVYWDFGDGSASIQMTPSHLYAQTGNYKVRLIESFNGFNFIDSVLITIHSCVGIEDKTENCKFGIYPNPSNGFVSIETTGLLNDINATITDMYGRLITGFIIPGSKTGVTITKKDFSAFPKGIYLFSFESNSLNKTEKIIFQ
jgi:hypothetical protein